RHVDVGERLPAHRVDVPALAGDPRPHPRGRGPRGDAQDRRHQRRRPVPLRPAGAYAGRSVSATTPPELALPELAIRGGTVVAGNCGYSVAPTRPADRASLFRTLDKVEDMRIATLEAGVRWDFETYPEYLDAVRRRGTAINFGGYVGHTAVRLYVMGDDAYE